MLSFTGIKELMDGKIASVESLAIQLMHEEWPAVRPWARQPYMVRQHYRKMADLLIYEHRMGDSASFEHFEQKEGEPVKRVVGIENSINLRNLDKSHPGMSVRL